MPQKKLPGSENARKPREDSHKNSHERVPFLETLSCVQVPPWLLNEEGIHIVLVSAHGKTEQARLSISSDKFTVKITSENNAPGGFFSKPKLEVRLIDVGEMDRIQRGQAHFEDKKKISNRDDSSALRIYSNGLSESASKVLALDPERSFSIIFRGAQTLDLMATDLRVRDDICDALDRILASYLTAKDRVAADVRLLRYVWIDLNRDINVGFANVSQVARVFQQINFSMKPRELQANYEKFGKVIGLDRSKRRRGLTFEQLADFLHYVRRNSWLVKPVTVVWNDLFGEVMNNGKKRETVSERTFLEKFLHEKQGQLEATLEDVRKLFRKIHGIEISHSSSSHNDVTRINKDQFEAYLLAIENDAFRPDKERLDVNSMNKPLSEYFINSSHNTYLIGDQYTSQSRVEMYSNALYRGCRCLELDIWDGAKSIEGEPIPVVWHGHTMTTKIFFVDIIRTIKIFLNFHPDTFPIILSFENHCSKPYQQVMAQQLLTILGESLYIPSEPSLNGALPSPAQIRGMVVIKGRRPSEFRKDNETDYGDSDEESEEDGPASSIAASSIGQVENLALQERRKQKQSHHSIAPELARLTLFHGTKFKNWPDSVRSPCNHMHSFSENKVRSKCRHKQTFDWIIYNQTHMSRTYPSGSRVDSSNYSPLLAWSTGCQMVALNFQTEDAFLRLNDGRFRENGNCGYVLKPSSLMTPKQALEFSATVPVRLTIQILSGSCLPKPKGRRTGDVIDPVIRLSVFDVSNEGKETISEFSTTVVRSNGFFPVWGHECYDFVVENWAAALLQLTVLDTKGDDFIGCCSIPISCLRKGIRSVKLYDATNSRSGVFDFASLLLDIEIAQVIAEI